MTTLGPFADQQPITDHEPDFAIQLGRRLATMSRSQKMEHLGNLLRGAGWPYNGQLQRVPLLDRQAILVQIRELMDPMQLEQLAQIVSRGPVEDGDIISKQARGELFIMALAQRVVVKGRQGFTAGTYAGWEILRGAGVVQEYEGLFDLPIEKLTDEQRLEVWQAMERDAMVAAERANAFAKAAELGDFSLVRDLARLSPDDVRELREAATAWMKETALRPAIEAAVPHAAAPYKRLTGILRVLIDAGKLGHGTPVPWTLRCEDATLHDDGPARCDRMTGHEGLHHSYLKGRTIEWSGKPVRRREGPQPSWGPDMFPDGPAIPQPVGIQFIARWTIGLPNGDSIESAQSFNAIRDADVARLVFHDPQTGAAVRPATLEVTDIEGNRRCSHIHDVGLEAGFATGLATGSNEIFLCMRRPLSPFPDGSHRCPLHLKPAPTSIPGPGTVAPR